MRNRAVVPRPAPGTRHRKASQCPGCSEPLPCLVLSPQPGEGKPPLSGSEKGLFVAAAFLFYSVRPNLGSEFPGADTPWASPYMGHRAWPPRREIPTSSKQRHQGRTCSMPWPSPSFAPCHLSASSASFPPCPGLLSGVLTLTSGLPRVGRTASIKSPVFHHITQSLRVTGTFPQPHGIKG